MFRVIEKTTVSFSCLFERNNDLFLLLFKILYNGYYTIYLAYYFVVFYFITFYFKVKSIEILPKNNNLRLAFSFDEWMAIFYLGIWITWFFKSKVYLHINLELVVHIVCLLSSRGNIDPRVDFFSLFWKFDDRAKKVFFFSDFGSPALSTSL